MLDGVPRGRAAWLLRWCDPVVVILLLASITHAARHDDVDLVSFLLVAAAIVVERAAHRPLRAPVRLVRLGGARLAGATIAVVVFAVVAGVGPHAGAVVRVAVCGAGLVGFLLVLRHPAAAGEVPTLGRGWLAWVVVLVLLALWELTNFLLQPDALTDSVEHPTLSTLIDPLLVSPVSRVVVLALWAAAGIWLVRRALAGGGGPVRQRATEPAAELGR